MIFSVQSGTESVNMEARNTTGRKQDLLDKLTELATLLSSGRKIDPETKKIRMQLEAIQVEIQNLDGYPRSNGEDR